MNQTDWDSVKSLFPRAMALPSDKRAAFVDRQCCDSSVVRAELEAMIAAADSDPDFLDEPAGVEEPPAEALDSLPPGTRLDAWEVRRHLGRGGMGDVYVAARADGTFTMEAALKVLKRGLDTDAILRRSLRERRILARLSHPNIARLLDAGATPDGRPFLVVELVDGVPITTWCSAHKSDVQQILGLMKTVCEAVAEAHRKLIVHRDLKPSNVLVDTAGRVKLLDFGIAKLLVDDDEFEAVNTVVAGPALTPAYAAPEQVRGAPVTPAADVYALGVMLYELLTGVLPHCRDATAMVLLRAGHADAPIPRPSLALLDPVEGSPLSPSDRKKRSRAISGDLDTVVLRALAAEPERRYGSAQELQEDLTAWLANRPVRAVPDSRRYRAARFLRRHRTSVAASTAAILALGVGLAATVWQGREVRAQREDVIATEARMAAMREYLQHMFRETGIEQSHGESVSARKVIEKAAARIRQEFGNDPDAARQILLEVGEMSFQMDDAASAEATFRQLLDIPGGGANLAESTAWAKERLASLLLSRPDNREEARRLLTEAQAIYASDLRRFGEALDNSRLTQAALERESGQNDVAVQILEKLYEKISGEPGVHPDREAVAVTELANAYFRSGRVADAARGYEKALVAFNALGQGESTNALSTLDNLCEAQRRSHQLEDAEACARRSISLRRSLYGPSAASVAALFALGDVLLDRNQPEQALVPLQEALELATRFVPEDTGLRDRIQQSMSRAHATMPRPTGADRRIDGSPGSDPGRKPSTPDAGRRPAQRHEEST